MVVWSIVLAVLVAAFVLIHVLVLPKAFLRTDFGRLPVTGRGVKSVDGESGPSMVYEPDIKAAKYIKQYVLSERGGKKFLLCKIDEKIKYIDFDIAVFDRDGNTVKILNVKEIISRQGFTEVCELPEETSFVTLSLNEVNGQKKGRGLHGEISPKNLAWYLSLSAVADLLGVVFAKICLTQMFGGIYSESFFISGKDWLYTFLIAAGAVAFNLLTASIYVLWKSGKFKGEDKNAKL
ncbi:MAG: hypothetical protein K2H30_04780 [Clostridia bacterium]|nr:hypothetical protein [Clostridia bacterium]MDE7265456.1 hypothetical protein [Clostridia bacterium]